MIRQITKNSQKIKSCFALQYSTVQEKWDLQAAICLERKPIITPELNPLEKEFQKVLLDVEMERSLKSDFEIRHENDIKQLELLKKGGEIDENEINLKQTAQDLVDLWTEELSRFQPAESITDADKNNKQNELNRKLEKHLVFVVNQEKNNKFHELPTEYLKQNETLRQCADRLLKKYCGDSTIAQIYGNAPCGFYKYKYPIDVRNKGGVQGAKVFVYFARFLKGYITNKDGNYKWLDRQELEKMLHPKCHKAVSEFLIDE